MPGRVKLPGLRTRLPALAVVLAGMACTDGDHPEQVLGPTASPESCDAPHIVFLNGGGGDYRYGAVSDSVTNTSSVSWFEPKDRAVTLPPAEFLAAGWQEGLDCLQARFHDFNVEFTLADPGDREHLEIVFSTDDLVTGLGCDTEILYRTCAPDNCSRSHREIGFMLGSRDIPSRQRVCFTAMYYVGFMAGLDHAVNTDDLMAGVEEWPVGDFVDDEVTCGTEQEGPYNCRCTGEPTQNSYQTLMEFFGPKCED